MIRSSDNRFLYFRASELGFLDYTYTAHQIPIYDTGCQKMIKNNALGWISFASLIVVLGFIPESTYAQCWTAAASTGVVDDGSRDGLRIGRRARTDIVLEGEPSVTDSRIYGFEDAIVAPRTEGSYSIRYNVTNVITGQGGSLALNVRYLVEDHDESRVIVQLKKYSLESPRELETAEVIAVIDSRSHGESADMQVRSTPVGERLEFGNFVYFIEAILVSSRQTPGLEEPGAPLRGPALGALTICSFID